MNVGQLFKNIKDIESWKDGFEKENNCQLVKGKVRTLEAARKRIPIKG